MLVEPLVLALLVLPGGSATSLAAAMPSMRQVPSASSKAGVVRHETPPWSRSRQEYHAAVALGRPDSDAADAKGIDQEAAEVALSTQLADTRRDRRPYLVLGTAQIGSELVDVIGIAAELVDGRQRLLRGQDVADPDIRVRSIDVIDHALEQSDRLVDDVLA